MTFYLVNHNLTAVWILNCLAFRADVICEVIYFVRCLHGDFQLLFYCLLTHLLIRLVVSQKLICLHVIFAALLKVSLF